MIWQYKIGFAIFITFTWLSLANAIDLIQEAELAQTGGDVGGLPSSAGDVTGDEHFVDLSDGDDIVEIRGSIAPASDEDMYRFTLSLPARFSATTNLSGDHIRIEDTKLFLFDEDGNGVCANEDNPNSTPTDLNPERAVLPQGELMTCMLEPGTYFLAISTFQRLPVNASGTNLFVAANGQLVPPDIIVPPNRGLTDTAIDNWAGSGRDGEYAIQLTGINYPPPECSEPVVDAGARTASLLALDPRLGLFSIEEVPGSRTPNITQLSIAAFVPGATEVSVEAVAAPGFQEERVDIEVTNTGGISITCSLVIPPLPDLIPPKCVDVFSLEGLPAVETTTQDDESGIRSIELLFVNNANVTVDGDPLPTADDDEIIEFNPPTNAPVLIRAEKIDLSRRATVLVEVCDDNFPVPNCLVCDPILFQLVVDSTFTAQQTYNDIPEFDHFITVQNGNGTPGSGLMDITIQVNDAPEHKFKLGPQQVIQLDIAAEMVPGLNTMTFEGKGLPGTQASIAVSNQQPATIEQSTSFGAILRGSGSPSSNTNYEWGH